MQPGAADGAAHRPPTGSERTALVRSLSYEGSTLERRNRTLFQMAGRRAPGICADRAEAALDEVARLSERDYGDPIGKEPYRCRPRSRSAAERCGEQHGRRCRWAMKRCPIPWCQDCAR